MSKPICEEMVSQTSPTAPGWNQWGVFDATGNFVALYGIESAVPEPSALYYLAAAGICDIRGQYQLGAASPSPLPTVAPTPLPTVAPIVSAVEPVQPTQPQGDINPVFNTPSNVIAGLVVIAVGAMVVGYFWSSVRRNRAGGPQQIKPPQENPFGE